MKKTIWIGLLFSTLLLAPLSVVAQTAGSQSSQSFEKQIVKTVSAKYLLYLPREYGKEAQKHWPLILFLHGSGESGDDLEKVKVHGPPKLIAAGKEFPFIIVSPQSPGGGWNTEMLNALLDEIIKKYTVDEDRVYLTGLSMGGFGTWSLALESPGRFAAIAPICGGGTPFRVRRLKDIAIWVFHGAKDPTVPIKASEDMVEALKKVGADVKFTVYPDAGHDSWTATYDNPELYTWFLQHSRKHAEKAGVTEQKADK
jgi:predicted peptidase